ncbi:MAG: hypothetical protein HIU93_08290 [Acidobacteria bacterium]|nr:hypothetical protein [Acidobacteriota bacterium]
MTSITKKILRYIATVVPVLLLSSLGLSAQQQSSSLNINQGPSASLESAAAPSNATAVPSRQYRVGVDDVLSISVWHEPDLSRSVPVRPDGRISLPLVGEVQAAGKTTPELEDELKASLSRYVKDPELTVIVAEIHSQRINIIGQVQHPGAFALTQSMGVLDALAVAGGLRDFAKKNKIYVLRETTSGHRARIPFNYKSVLRGKSGSQDVLLQPNDTVVVP